MNRGLSRAITAHNRAQTFTASQTHAALPITITPTTDADTVYLDIQVSSTETYLTTVNVIRQTIAHTPKLRFTVSQIVYALAPTVVPTTDADTVYVDIDCSATVDDHTTFDTDTVNIDIDCSAVEDHTNFDADTVLIDIQVSGVDVYVQWTPPVRAIVAHSPSYRSTPQQIVTPPRELITYTDSATVYVDLDVATFELAEFVDTSTVGLLITPSTADIAQFTEVSTVYVDIDCSSIEDHTTFDADTLYLDIQVSGVDVYVQWTPPIRAIVAHDPRQKTMVAQIVTPPREFATTTDAATIYVDIDVASIEIAEFADSNTVYVDVSLTSVELIEAVDSSTAYVDIDLTSTEDHTTFDTSSVYVDIQPSTADVTEFVDADSVYVDIQVSSFEIYAVTSFVIRANVAHNPRRVFTTSEIISGLVATPAALVDADTVYVDIQATGAFEEHATFDLAEIYLDIQVSSVEEYAVVAFVARAHRAYDPKRVFTVSTVISPLVATPPAPAVDADTVYVDIQVTSVEQFAQIAAAVVRAVIAHTPKERYAASKSLNPLFVSITPVDAAEVYLDIQVSAVDTAQYVETATVYVDIDCSSADIDLRVDSQTVLVDLQVASADIAQFVDAQTVNLLLSPTSTDVFPGVDSNSAYVDIQVASTELYFQIFTDADSVYLDLSLSSVDAFVPADADSVYVDIQATSTDVAALAEAQTVPLTITASSVDIAQFVDTNSVYVDLDVQSTEVPQLTDASELYVDISASPTDVLIATESDTVYLDIQASTALEEHATTDLASVYVDLDVSTQDAYGVQDAATLFVDIQVQSVELFFTMYHDAATIPVVLLPSAAPEIALFGDVQLVGITITPISLDVQQTLQTDFATVYVDIQTFDLVINFDLVLMGHTVRWTFQVRKRYSLIPVVRLFLLPALKRYIDESHKKLIWRQED